MRVLTWESGLDVVTMSDEMTAPIFADFDEFTPNTVSGVYDRKTVFGLDGTVLVNAQLSGRPCGIKGIVLAHNIGSQTDPVKEVLERYRRELCRAFNPKRKGRLTYRNHSGETLYIDATPTSLPVFSAPTISTVTFRVEVTADTSYWQEAGERSVELGKTVAAASLPATLPMTLAAITSLTAAVDNASDEGVHPRVRINATPLPVVLTNITNGKRLAMSTKVDDGYYVIVDTEQGAQEATLYKKSLLGDVAVESVTHWIAPESDVDFTLNPGTNVLQINDTVTSTDEPSCCVTWHAARLGV